MLPRHQSGFRARHSMETAVLKVMLDILTAANQGRVTLLGLLNMSAALDTVDHDILLRRLETSFVLTGSVTSWLSSFLRERTQQVTFNNVKGHVRLGVPTWCCYCLLHTLLTSRAWKSCYADSSHGSSELCSRWLNTIELAAGRI